MGKLDAQMTSEELRKYIISMLVESQIHFLPMVIKSSQVSPSLLSHVAKAPIELRANEIIEYLLAYEKPFGYKTKEIISISRERQTLDFLHNAIYEAQSHASLPVETLAELLSQSQYQMDKKRIHYLFKNPNMTENLFFELYNKEESSHNREAILLKMIEFSHCSESIMELALKYKNYNTRVNLAWNQNLPKFVMRALASSESQVLPNLASNTTISLSIFEPILVNMEENPNLFSNRDYTSFLINLLHRKPDKEFSSRIAIILLNQKTASSLYGDVIVRHINDLAILHEAIYGKWESTRAAALKNPFLPSHLQIAGALIKARPVDEDLD